MQGREVQSLKVVRSEFRGVERSGESLTIEVDDTGRDSTSLES